MIQKIGEFMKKWGGRLSVIFGVCFMIVTLVFQLRGLNSYQYYDERRYNNVIEVPIVANYFIGFVFIIAGFRKEWIWGLKRRIKNNFKIKARK